MLKSYRRSRLRSYPLRYSTLENYLTTPIFGVIGALTLHRHNWNWFKQEHIYEWEGPEKDAQWREARRAEIYRHFKFGFYFLAAGALGYVVSKIRKKYFFLPRGQEYGFFERWAIDLGLGLNAGGFPVEMLFYAYSVRDEKKAQAQLELEQAETNSGGGQGDGDSLKS